MKKILFLMLIASLADAAQQLEKPKLSCMGKKLGLLTLEDRLAIIQASHTNFINTQDVSHRQKMEEQAIAIHQLSHRERCNLLAEYIPQKNWEDNFTQISRKLIRDKNCKKGWTFPLTGVVTLVCLNAWLAKPHTPHQAYAPHHEYPRMHPRFYELDPARYDG